MNYLIPINTQRLFLREIEYTDGNDFYEYAKTLDVGPFAGWEPHRDVEQTLRIIKIFKDIKMGGSIGVWSIILKEENKMIGTIELFDFKPGYKAELGYALNPNYWNNGYITEAAFGVISYAFRELQLERISLTAYTTNTASRRIAEKLGFEFEGIQIKGSKRYDKKIFDLAMYGITKEKFIKLYR